MKILFTECSDFKTFPMGGQLSYIKTLATSLSHEIFLCGISTTRGGLGKWSEKKIGDRCFPFYSVGYINPKGFVYKIFPLRIIFTLLLYFHRKAILESGAEVIFVQAQETALPFIAAGMPPVVLRLAGATNPLKGSRFGWARNKFLQKAYEALISRRILRNVAAVVGINDDCMRLCEQLGAKDYEKIQLGVDCTLFKPVDKSKCREEIGLTSDSSVFVFVGRLSKIKDPDLLLNGFSCLHKRLPDARLLIIGDGEEWENIRSQIHQKGLDRHVNLYGSLSHDKIPRILNAADVFVLTSFAEGVPNAMLEAMACSLPVVSTNVGGIKEVVKTGVNGILLDNREPEDLAAALSEAYEQREKLGMKALETIVEKYSIISVADKMSALFGKLAKL